MLDRLSDSSAWPSFNVPLAEGHSITVHYNNGEEHSTTDYVLSHPCWTHAMVLASDDQDRIGPGLCWPELAALLEAPPWSVAQLPPYRASEQC